MSPRVALPLLALAAAALSAGWWLCRGPATVARPLHNERADLAASDPPAAVGVDVAPREEPGGGARGARAPDAESGGAPTRTPRDAPTGRVAAPVAMPDDVAPARTLFELVLSGPGGAFRMRWTGRRPDVRLTAPAVTPGRYELIVVTGPGDAAVTARSARWTTEPRSIEVFAQQTAQPRIELRATGAREPPPTVTLVGHVYLDGRPASGLLLDVLPSSDAMIDTGVDGSFRLSDVPVGRRLLVLRSEQLEAGYTDLHYVYERRVLDLQPGAQVPLAIHVRAGTVRGTVRDADGHGIAGARVALRGAPVVFGDPTDDAEPRVIAVADARGDFAFERVPLGTYELTSGGSETPSRSAHVELARSAATVSVDSTLAASVRVRGRVDTRAFAERTRRGNAIRRVVFEGPVHRSARPDPNGDFTVELVPGRYDVAVELGRSNLRARPVEIPESGSDELSIRPR